MSGSSKTKRASSKRRQGSDRRRRDGWREVLGIVLLALAILTTLALATYPPPNLLRGLGDGISNFIIPFTLGRWPSFVFPFLLFFWSGAVLLRWKRIRVFWGSMGALLLALWASFLIFLVEAPEIITVHTGLLGWAFGDMISNFMGAIGAWILWSLVVMTALILFLRFRPSLILRKSLDVGKPAAAGLWAWLLEQFKRRPSEPLEDTVALELEPEISNLADLPSEEPLPADQELEIPTQQQSLSLETPARILPDAPLRPKGEYHLPPLTLLNDPPPDSPDAPDELRSKAKRLQAALADFGVGAKVVKVNPGPVITRFDLEPDPGVKVSRISALADDLALVLRARAIRIQAPIPGQGAVGVEIPNRQPSTVVLKSVLAHSSFQDHKSLLAIALGQTAAGDPYVSDLSKMPHLLVAGTTGSGKSVCLHSIIASLLFRNPPNQVQFVIIDPKKLEMSIYARLARHHLLNSPELDEEVITTPANAVLALGGVEMEMGRRYDLLAGAGVRNIEEFNALASRGEAVSPDGETLPPLSYLLVVIDELADLMLVSAKEIEEPIARLAQMARAVGIHLIVATQRPSVDVITGVIKANFPARIAFQVASKVDSRTILDANGAEALLGNGDALFIPPGRGTPERLHSCYISPAEIEALVSFIEDQPDDFYRYPLLIPKLEGVAEGPDGQMIGEADELFDDAARIVIHQGQASVSILQRRLKIGYARAGRLIDQLERAGIVGPFDGSKAREVLVDEEYLFRKEGFPGLRGAPPPSP